MNKRTVAIGGIVIVAAAAVGLVLVAGAFGDQKEEVTYLTAPASVEDVRETVSVSGSIRPTDTYGLAFGQPPVRSPIATTAALSTTGASSTAAAGLTASAPWTVATVAVEPGQAVQAGDVLATAETADAELALTVAQANLEAAEARLRTDESPVSRTARRQARLGVTQARRQLSNAGQTLAQTQASGRLAVRQTQAILSDAKAQLAADRDAGVPASVISADKAAVKQASRAVDTARRQASSANTQAANGVEAARLGVQSANLSFKGATEVDTDALVAADRAAVAQAQMALADATEALERATISAPIAGIVSSVSVKPGDTASGVVIRLRAPDVEVAASINESDLPSVALGQPADVTVPALDTTVAGTVESIDLAGATKSASGVVSYDIVIALDEPPAHVAPSMTADIDITTASAPAVLAVPFSAIGGEPGAYTVQVFEGPGRVRTVPVEVGLLTPSFAEIRSGITEGTEVVTGTATAKDLVTSFPTPPGAGGGSNAGPTP